jgi:hypothetical protein
MKPLKALKQAIRRRAIERCKKLGDEALKVMVAHGYDPEARIEAILGRDGHKRRPGETVRAFVARACACSEEQVSEFVERLSSGEDPYEAEANVRKGKAKLLWR